MISTGRNEPSLIGSSSGRGQALEGDLRRRATGRQPGVEIADHLRADAAEVDGHLVAVDDDLDADRDVLADRHRVVVHERLRLRKHRPESRARPRGRNVRSVRRSAAMLCRNASLPYRCSSCSQAPLAGPNRRHLRTEVAHRAIRMPAVGAMIAVSSASWTPRLKILTNGSWMPSE